ncbi:putative ribonuclease H protein At1g65750 family [Senna tora]|uniref:Putative ribonuclease H protein At1g65750 family n=1 Tax=Senna tora TaxID=362788 RepID=A0A834TWC7_9FABA|nr:putative ribonuclease H protein At1g65750 family [Senna tora]
MLGNLWMEIVNRIHQLLEFNWIVSLEHVDREANRVAHDLVAMASSMHRRTCSFLQPPVDSRVDFQVM